MIRLRALDSDSAEKREVKKEYLYFHSELYGTTWLGKEIRYGRDFFTGKYMKQTRVLKNDIDFNTGKVHSYYEMGIPVVAYNIPFSKANVDKYLLDAHPFGPDSENITDINSVRYYGKFTNEDTGTVSHDDDTYSSEQFILPSWREFCDLDSRQGGPRAKSNAKYRAIVNGEEQKINQYQ